MIKVLKESKIKSYKTKNPKRSGRKTKLSLEDNLLMTLEYWREYRTFFHIAQAYGISETTCNDRIRSIEDILIRSKHFQLPSKKKLFIQIMK